MERTQTLMRQKFGTLGAVLAALALTLVLLPTVTVPASAATASELKTTIESYTGSLSEPGTLSAVVDGNTVTVTGTVTNATRPLPLNIGTGVTVDWQAKLSSGSSFPSLRALIELSGSGTLKVDTDGEVSNLSEDSGVAIEVSADGSNAIEITSGGKVYSAFAAIVCEGAASIQVNGGEVSSEMGSAITLNKDHSSITVSHGGKVSVIVGRHLYSKAIHVTGADSSVTVSDGGEVSVIGTYSSAISVLDASSSVTVTGGKVSSTDFITIEADSVKVTGGEVSSNHGNAIKSTSDTVLIEGGTVSSTNFVAIVADNVTVSGGTVTSGYHAISASGTVTVSGGLVTATTRPAISTGGMVIVNGGTVFAYGTGISDVISSTFTAYFGNSIVIAWNQSAGVIAYAKDTSDDIFTFSSTADNASATWKKVNGVSGISYTVNSDANTGFIPITITNFFVGDANTVPATPTLSSKSATSVTLNVATATGGSGTYQYTMDSGSTAPTRDSSWDSGTSFPHLSPGSTYHFFARSAKDDTHAPSAASAPLSVTTPSLGLSASGLATTNPTLKNQGKYTVGAPEQYRSYINIAVTGTAVLETYESSVSAQGEGRWIGLLIGPLTVGDDNQSLTDLWYKTNGGSYTQLTAADAAEAASVGGDGSTQFVYWFKADSLTESTIKTLYLATNAGGTENAASISITFTPYHAPIVTPPVSGGGSGGGGFSAPTAPAPSTSGSTVTTTVTPTVKNGAATASVPASQVSAALAAAKKAAASGEAPKVEISLGTTAGATSAAATIPQESVKALASGGVGGLTVSSGVADLTFDAAALGAIAGAASGSVTVSASKVDTATLSAAAQALVGSRPVFEFFVTSGGKTVSQFGGSVAVSVPYALGAGEDPNAVIVSYLNASGNLETVMNCRYDAASGTVTFTTTHFSQYAVGYNKVTFTDVADGSWCADAVTFLAARGITGGTGDGSTFSPNAPLTRGQFITFLLRAYGVEPLDGGDNFSDAGDTYYTGYLAAAKRLGVTSGVGSNQFAPDRAISRQQMLTLAYNALKVLEELPEGASGKTLSDFTDSASVAGYAQEAMTALVKSGTVAGSGGKLNPQAITSRGQMAQVLYNLLGK